MSSPAPPWTDDEARSLIIAGLPSDTKSRELRHLFAQSPGFESCQIVPQPLKPIFGMVVFNSPAAAIQARDKFQGYRFDPDIISSSLRIELASPKSFASALLHASSSGSTGTIGSGRLRSRSGLSSASDELELESVSRVGSAVISDASIATAAAIARSELRSSLAGSTVSNASGDSIPMFAFESSAVSRRSSDTSAGSNNSRPISGSFSPVAVSSIGSQAHYLAPNMSSFNSNTSSSSIDGGLSAVSPSPESSPRSSSYSFPSAAMPYPTSQSATPGNVQAYDMNYNSSKLESVDENVISQYLMYNSNPAMLGSALHQQPSGQSYPPQQQNVQFLTVPTSGTAPPCSTIFVGNLSNLTTERELQRLFEMEEGFKRIRFSRKGASTPVAFVEFDSEANSIHVLNAYQGHPLPSSDRGGIRLEFARSKMGSPARASLLSQVGPTLNTNNQPGSTVQPMPMPTAYGNMSAPGPFSMPPRRSSGGAMPPAASQFNQYPGYQHLPVASYQNILPARSRLPSQPLQQQQQLQPQQQQQPFARSNYPSMSQGGGQMQQSPYGYPNYLPSPNEYEPAPVPPRNNDPGLLVASQMPPPGVQSWAGGESWAKPEEQVDNVDSAPLVVEHNASIEYQGRSTRARSDSFCGAKPPFAVGVGNSQNA